jgi:hypothetical protein
MAEIDGAGIIEDLRAAGIKPVADLGPWEKFTARRAAYWRQVRDQLTAGIVEQPTNEALRDDLLVAHARGIFLNYELVDDDEKEGLTMANKRCAVQGCSIVSPDNEAGEKIEDFVCSRHLERVDQALVEEFEHYERRGDTAMADLAWQVIVLTAQEAR